ncbi:ABC transporter ATP-binding protein [Candidatus Nomurabacteria bacterium]|nr:ABC transporter ATP-binding protein [Candidatus Nomurabacteria bacterium]
MPTHSNKKIAPAGSVLRMYWAAVIRYPYHLIAAVIGILIIQAGYVLSPIYLSQFITQLAQLEPSPQNAAILLTPLFLYATLELLAWIGHRIEMLAGVRLTPKVMADLTNQAFSHLLHHSYQFFTSSFAGALTRRVTRYAHAFDKLYDSIAHSLGPALLYIVGIIIVLGTRSALLSVILLVWTVLFVFIQWWLIRWQQPLRRARAEEDSNVTAAVADSISNQTTIQLFSGNQYENGLVHNAARKWQNALTRVWMSEWWIYGTLGLFALAINVVLLWVALQYWQQGLLVVGDFVLIQAYVFRLMNHIWSIGREFRSIYTSIADAGEMVALLETPHEVTNKKGAKPLATKNGEVWFDDVSFRFGDGKNVLHQFNLRIAPGEKVALVGPSGAGKSTVTKLLLRLYDVDKGNINIDGQNIAEVTQDSVRDAIAFVPQEPILFHRTLMENIRYGRRDATDAEVIEAAKAAHCHEFIDALPQKYETYVGERGIKLSGGERQRVAIARAILKDAPILVLDEATSSLDSESEAYIQDALETLMEGKTVITVAHRLSTIMKMDRIVVMQGGAIVAMGTHLELIREQGLYQKLWSIQAGGFLGDGEKPKEITQEDTVPLAEEEEDQ